MAFPQATDYRPPIIPDGEIYDNLENGKSYYWTQILLPEGSTPDTATSIGGYWTVVCEPFDNRHLLRHGDTVDDLQEPAEYIWNDDVQFESTGLKGVLLPKEIEKSETDEKHITNKEYVDTQDGILAGEADARSEFLCAQFFKVLANYSEVEKADGHVIAEYNFGEPSGRKYWTRPPQPGFFANGESYYINDQGPYVIELVTEDNKWVTFFIKGGPSLSLGSYASFSKTRKLCTEINLLQNDVIELEEEINAIAPSLEYGNWEWVQPPSNARAPEKGTFYLLDGLGQLTTEYKDTAIVDINNYEYDDPNDNDPVDIHTWADADPGELIQLFDAADPDFMLGKITDVASATENTSNGLLEFVRLTNDLIQSSGVPNDNLDPVTGKYLTRVNVFKEPSGGTASDFVLKAGDTMEGPSPLVFKTKETTHDYNNPPTNSSYLKFLNDKNGTINSVNLWLGDNTNTLTTDHNFMARGSIYTKEYYYAYGTSGTNKPRVRLQSSTGSLQSDSTVALAWDSTGVNKILLKSSEGSSGYVLRLDSSKKPYWSSPPMPPYTITKSNGNYYVQ